MPGRHVYICIKIVFYKEKKQEEKIIFEKNLCRKQY